MAGESYNLSDWYSAASQLNLDPQKKFNDEEMARIDAFQKELDAVTASESQVQSISTGAKQRAMVDDFTKQYGSKYVGAFSVPPKSMELKEAEKFDVFDDVALPTFFGLAGGAAARAATAGIGAASTATAAPVTGAVSGAGPTGLITTLPEFSGPLSASTLLGTEAAAIGGAAAGGVSAALNTGIEEIVITGTAPSITGPVVGAVGGGAAAGLGVSGVGGASPSSIPVDEEIVVTGTPSEPLVPSIAPAGVGVASTLGLDTTLPDFKQPLSEDQLTQPSNEKTPAGGFPDLPPGTGTVISTLLGIGGGAVGGGAVGGGDAGGGFPDPRLPEPPMGPGGTSESAAILDRLGYFRSGRGNRYQQLALPVRKASQMLYAG